jgi:SAM-dependent methyltransferase
MGANQANIDHWNSPLTRRWVTEQERLDRVFSRLDDVALARTALRAGERVVEIGCGCGASTLRCAELVGPGGSVLGVDVSRMMLERARERTQHLPHVKLLEADATDHAFAGDADLLYSRLGVMFFAEPEVAFANLRRALRPGGRLCFVCWRKPEDNPWYTVPVHAVASLVALPAQPPEGSAGPFAFAREAYVRGVLQAAGWRDIALETHDIALETSTAGLDEAVRFAFFAGPLARILSEAKAPEALEPQLRAAVRAALASHVSGDSVTLGAGLWIATARA